jgi:hypothetical protein
MNKIGRIKFNNTNHLPFMGSGGGAGLSASGVAGNIAIFTSTTQIGPTYGNQLFTANGSSNWTLAGTGAQNLEALSGFILIGSGSARLALNTTIQLGTTSLAQAFMVLGPNGVSSYNNINTVASGVAPLYAKSDLTAQSAAISGTLLYTTPNAATPSGEGQYRICWSAVVTTQATTSATLGGTTGFTVTYTDLDTGLSITTLANPTGTQATNPAVGTQINGEVIVNAKRNTAIDINFGYSSSGTTAMVFALHTKLEYLG